MASLAKTWGNLHGKLAVEILVASNPNPNPGMAFQSLSDGTEIPRHADGPEARVGTQPFQLQRRMSWVLKKLLVSGTGGIPDASGKLAITLPKSWSTKRLHDPGSKSRSWISGKRLGFALNCAASSSPSAVSVGRGRGSDKMRSHVASPFNSGRIPGKSATNFSRSVAGSA